MSTKLRGRIVVLSPHPDDAVLSLGAALAQASRTGAAVEIVTVLAGDPRSRVAAGQWDRLAGFATAGEAAAARSREDDEACTIIGATPKRLPFFDRQYGERGGRDDEIWTAISDAVGNADVVLLPGAPLANEDHAWLVELVLARRLAAERLCLYVEQPYAVLAGREAIGELGSAWQSLPTADEHKKLKLEAIRAYRSQVPLLGGVRVMLEVLRYEARRGGESVKWVPPPR